MSSKLLIIILVLLLSGAGCGWGKSSELIDQTVPIIPAAGIYGVLPVGWQIVPLKTFIKAANTPSGFAILTGAWQIGAGPKDTTGRSVALKARVLAIPKIKTSEYEAGKDPATATRLFVTDDFVIYGATQLTDDRVALSFISSLRFVGK